MKLLLTLILSSALLPRSAGADTGTAAPVPPLEVKVLIINMFGLEAGPWLDALKPTQEIRNAPRRVLLSGSGCR